MSHPEQHLPSHWTPVQAAYYQTVHGYVDPRTGKRGGEALGPKLGKSGRTVSNEANPDLLGHKPGLEDSITIQLLTGDYRVLYAYAATLNHVAIPLPDFTPCSDVELLNRFSAWQSAMGRTCQEIHSALEDRVITTSEARTIRRMGQAHMQAFLEFMSRVESIAQEDGDAGQ